jgi:cell division protein FtsW (lipid II flippase)
MAWLNPNAPDPNDYNWQSQHGIWALAAGGIGGVGLGNSKLKWSWIPEAENDFIFAIIGEEEGLLGAVAVIALFIFMGFLFKRIAERTVDIYSRSVVIGVGIWILGQALVNIAVVLNLLPVLGVPLPLISAGGSSLAANLVAIGIVLSIERENQAHEDAPALFRKRSNASTRRQPALSKR